MKKYLWVCESESSETIWNGEPKDIKKSDIEAYEPMTSVELDPETEDDGYENKISFNAVLRDLNSGKDVTWAWDGNKEKGGYYCLEWRNKPQADYQE
jgi:hypothetical protein